MQSSVLDLAMNDTCDGMNFTHDPPHLSSVATVACESRNTEKCNITVEYYQRKSHQMCRIALSKWTCRLQHLGCYAAMRVRNKDL